MDSLIQNLAETLVYIREHGPGITSEEIERRKYYPFGYPPPCDTWIHLHVEQNPKPSQSHQSHILCWVPEWARDWVDDLIALNWEGEYSWVTLKDDQLHIKGWGERWQD